MLEEGDTERAVRPGATVPAELGRDSALGAFVPKRRRPDIRDGSGVAEAAPFGTAKRRDAIFRRSLALADVLAATVTIVVGGALLAPTWSTSARSSACR
jgi:hypothetical protein